MNKVYKVIWSKAKNCYVVASELAKSHTKAPASGIINRTVVASVLACVLSCGAIMSVYAAGTDSYEAGGGSATGTNTVVIGHGSSGSGSDGTVVGNLNVVSNKHNTVLGFNNNVSGENNVVIGQNMNSEMTPNSYNVTGTSNVLIGTRNEATFNNSIVIGDNSHALADRSLVMGAWSGVYGNGGVALGSLSNSYALGVTVGYSANSSKDASIALGSRALSSADFSQAVGYNAKSNGFLSVSNGSASVTDGALSSTLGARSYAGSRMSVAIGAYSSTGGVGTDISEDKSRTMDAWGNYSDYGYQYNDLKQDSVVSFGHKAGDAYLDDTLDGDNYTLNTFTDDYYRRLINVADGTDDHDVATVGQLNNRTKFVSVNGASTDSNYLGNGATGTDAIAIGKDALASGNQSISIGTGNQVTGNNSGAIGDPNIVNGDNSYVVGNNSTVASNIKNAFVMGNSTTVNNGTSTTVGEGVVALGNNINVSLDNKASNSRSSSSEGAPKVEHVVALGDGAIIGEENTVAIGYTAKAIALNATAVGEDAQATGEGTNAIGHSAKATGHFANALGYQAQALKEGGAAFGQGAVASEKFGTAFGRLTKAQGEGSTAIGNNANAVSQSAVAIGLSSIANGGGNTSSVAIGNGARTGKVDGEGNPTNGYGETIAIGGLSYVENAYASAIGSSANVTGQGGTALGSHASVTAENAVALGYNAVANEANTVSVGTSSATRKIVNVTDATNAQDASTAGQTGNQLAVSGNTLSLKSVTGATLNSVTLPTGSALHGFSTVFGNTTEGNYDNDGAGNIGAIAIGQNASANPYYSIAIGMGAGAGTESSNTHSNIAIGYHADASGASATAIGGNSSSTGGYAVAVGVGAQANEQGTVALGNRTRADGTSSVALGVDSIAGDDYVVSVGHKSGDYTYGTDLKRRIINVADGTSATNAATVGQTIELVAGDNVTITPDTTATNAIGQKRYKISTTGAAYTAGNGIEISNENAISAKAGTNVTVDNNGINVVGNGVIDEDNTGLISGGTLYNEVNVASNGNYIVAGDTTAQNLGKLDTAIKNVDNSSIKSMTANGTTVTYTKGDGTTGTFTTQDNNTEYTAGNGLELTGTEFKAKAGMNVTINGDGISVIGNGTVANGNTGLVSGGTVFSETRVASNGNYIQATNTASQNLVALDNALKNNADALNGKANVALDNITDAGKTVIKTNAKEAINVVGSGKATVNKTDVSGVDTYTVGVTVDGSVANGNTGIVDGGTVYNALIAESRPAQNGNYIRTSNTAGANLTALDTAIKNATDGLDGKANVSLNNITDAGKTVIQNATNVVSGDSVITVTPTTENGVKTYTITASVNPDGAIAEGNTGLVSGGAVYNEVRPTNGNYIEKVKTTAENLTALDNAIKNATDGLDGKANVALDNVTDAGHAVIKTDAKASINVTGGNYATVDKTDVNGVDTYTVNVATDGAVADGNTKLVTGDTVYDALQTQKTEIDTALDNKANRDASNVSSYASEWGTAIGTGTVNASDGKLVTGATVAGETRVASNGNYIQASNTAGQNLVALDNALKNNADALDGKANVSLNNVTDAGHTVIKTDAKSVINVVGNGDVSVNKTDVNGVDTYNLSVVKDGAVASGEEKLVTGGAVYDALVAETRPAQDGNYIVKDGTAGENLTALDGAVKANEDAIATNAGDITNLKNLSNITEAGETVIKNLAKGSVNVIGTDKATVTKSDVNGVDTYTVSVKADGQVAQGDTNIVSGDTVYQSLQTERATTNTALDGKANVGLDNITDDGHTVIKTDAKASINVIGGNYATVDKTDVDGVDTYTVNVATDGAIAQGDTKLVTGGTVYEAIQARDQALTDDLNNKANKDASNVADYATEWGTAIGSGKVEANDGKLVTGDTVFKALQTESRPALDGNYILKDNTAGENLTVLDTQVKANADAIATNTGDITNLKNLSNITEAGENVIKNLAKGSVNVVGSGKANVTKTDVSGVDTYTVDVQANGEIEDNNKDIVNGGTVFNAIKAVAGNIIDYTDARLDGKANVKLDNITNEGHDVIKTDAKSAINVTGDTDALVTKTDVNGVDTYAISINKNGAVAQDNEEIVTGGTVYNALQGQRNEINDVLDTKANIDLDNITDNGKTVVRNLAKESVKVISGSEHVTITEGTDGNAKTYAVDVLANGAVEGGNTGLVTGNTVFDEVRVENDGNYVLKSNTAGQNITELDRVLKETRDIAEAAALTGTDANAVHYDGMDKSTVTLAGAEGTLLTNLKDGDISATSTDAVTGKQLFETNERIGQVETRVDTLETTVGTMTDGNYIGADKSVGENLSVLDSELKNVSDGLNTVTNDIGELRDNLDGKLNTNMDNLTSDGESVISTIAKNAVKVEGTGLATVTSAEKDNAMVYTVDVRANGKVEEGNTDLVNGGTVYDAVQGAKDYADGLNTETRDYVTEKLEDKADTDLGNITEVGKEKIRETMKDDLDKKANVDASNINPDVWAEKLGVGEIADGNTGLVNGGTVFKALQDIEDSAVVKADFDAGVIRVGGTPKYDEIGVMDISNSQGEGRVLTGVVTDPSDANSAANVGYVNAVGENIIGNVNAGFNRMDAKINKVGANAAAMASLSPIPNEDDTKWNIAAAVGNYKDATAGAVGVFYKPAENVMLNVRGSFGNDENMVGGGVTFALSKSEVPGVTKATLAKAVNTQAQHIKELESNNQQLQQDNEAMRQMMMQMQERLEKLEKNSK